MKKEGKTYEMAILYVKWEQTKEKKLEMRKNMNLNRRVAQCVYI